MSMEITGEPSGLFAALIKAQADMGAVLKGNVNPAFKSRYADLSSVLEAVLPALTKHGLALIQSPSFDGEIVTVETVIAHDKGAFLRSALSMKPTKADPQGVGSAVTYARRYSILALAGVAPEDDDGNAASAPGEGGKRYSAYQAKKDGLGPRADELKHEIATLESPAACTAWANARASEIRAMPENWRDMLREELETQRTLVTPADDFPGDQPQGTGAADKAPSLAEA